MDIIVYGLAITALIVCSIIAVGLLFNYFIRCYKNKED